MLILMLIYVSELCPCAVPVWPQEHLPPGDGTEIHIVGRIFLAHYYAVNVIPIMSIMLRPHFRTLHFFKLKNNLIK